MAHKMVICANCPALMLKVAVTIERETNKQVLWKLNRGGGGSKIFPNAHVFIK